MPEMKSLPITGAEAAALLKLLELVLTDVAVGAFCVDALGFDEVRLMDPLSARLLNLE